MGSCCSKEENVVNKTQAQEEEEQKKEDSVHFDPGDHDTEVTDVLNQLYHETKDNFYDDVYLNGTPNLDDKGFKTLEDLLDESKRSAMKEIVKDDARLEAILKMARHYLGKKYRTKVPLRKWE